MHFFVSFHDWSISDFEKYKKTSLHVNVYALDPVLTRTVKKIIDAFICNVLIKYPKARNSRQPINSTQLTSGLHYQRNMCNRIQI
jgi:hypothetical protein